MLKYFLIASILFLSQFALADEGNLEFMGLLSGQNLYMIYAASGFLYDASQANVYEKGFSLRMAREMGSSIKKTKLLLEKLIETGKLQEDDLRSARQIVEAYESLTSMINSLYSASENPNAETKRQYERLRARSWNKIADILNLETE